ncbi:hypothetical protein AN964_19240 [Heyndrickxia shackletonii]|uniref:DUF1934 domain-containing protein n=1 Tax=Heyndrickxia shackletonii TaxID=157838 RepID=A0A0Q3WTC6_9BACI|nr:DUF1934 domain-containing protein [Heyndrickxia shackletonii]KQL51141.1 hypothetical protein AN964_19240 [Heyndrickxia shackletonii]
MTVETRTSIPVKIHLKTTIDHGEEAETYELTLFGEYYQKEQAAFLKYEELLQEGSIQTVVKVKEQEALILRSGSIKMRLAFDLENEKAGSYEGEYGTLLLTTKTKSLENRKNDSGRLSGKFILKYDLKMQGSIVGTYEMVLEYKEVSE